MNSQDFVFNLFCIDWYRYWVFNFETLTFPVLVSTTDFDFIAFVYILALHIWDSLGVKVYVYWPLLQAATCFPSADWFPLRNILVKE